jgi:hypothetical protein
LEAKLQSESKNGAELAKQQRHNHNEGVDTLQGASELSNSIGLNLEVLRGLNTTFESQLGGIMDGTNSSFHRHINVVPPSPAAAYNHTRSVPSFADHRELELERLEAESKQIDANIKSTKQHTKDVVKQTRAVYASIKANRLQVTHANAKHQNNVMQTDIEDELKREKEWTAKVAEASAYVAELKARVPKLVR